MELKLKDRLTKVIELLEKNNDSQGAIKLLREIENNPLQGEIVHLVIETQEVDIFEEAKYNLDVFATEEEAEAAIKEYKEVDGYEHEYDIEAFEIKGGE